MDCIVIVSAVGILGFFLWRRYRQKHRGPTARPL